MNRKTRSLFATIFLLISLCCTNAFCSSIWPATAVPGTPDAGADNPVELGIRFYSEFNGYITGIRFYKAAANTGAHVGTLWSTDGTVLASGTFTDETASGWQQLNFATPVPITAGTDYVASYHTNTGHYSCDQYSFTAAMHSSALHVPRNIFSSPNGLYGYGASSTFPTNGFRSSNYWVDVVFSTSLWSPTTVPGLVDSGPDDPVELGVKFTSDTDGYVSGIRFYKATTNTGTHVGNLWDSAGNLLASATFTNETASGWQQVQFSSPVPITAHSSYVASYHTSTGHYSFNEHGFDAAVDAAPLHAPADEAGSLNGLYAYGTSSNFPGSSWHSSNYWVDIVYSPAGTAPTQPGLLWQSTYNCSEWTATKNPSPSDLNCDGLLQWGGWSDLSGDMEQITAAANYTGSGGTAGSLGQRHWSDSPNGASGGTAIGLGEVGNEVWIRFYIRFQEGFTWDLNNMGGYMGDKLLYFMDNQWGGNQNVFLIGTNWNVEQAYNSIGAVDYETQAASIPYHYTADAGFENIWGNPSDGSWHCFELYLKNNSIGQADGVYRFWLDGVLKADYTNVQHSAWPGGFVIGSNIKFITGGPYYTDFDEFYVTSATPANWDATAAHNRMIGPIGWINP